MDLPAPTAHSPPQHATRLPGPLRCPEPRMTVRQIIAEPFRIHRHDPELTARPKMLQMSCWLRWAWTSQPCPAIPMNFPAASGSGSTSRGRSLFVPSCSARRARLRARCQRRGPDHEPAAASTANIPFDLPFHLPLHAPGPLSLDQHRGHASRQGHGGRNLRSDLPVPPLRPTPRTLLEATPELPT
jgi:hypothetical protein